MTNIWSEIAGYLEAINGDELWELGLKYKDKNIVSILAYGTTIVELTQGEVMTIDKEDLDILRSIASMLK